MKDKVGFRKKERSDRGRTGVMVKVLQEEEGTEGEGE